MIRNKRTGQLSENYAASVLEKKGYKIIARNYKTKQGELDIIAKDNDTICFIEVKTRSSKRYGLPQEAVDKKSLKRLKNSLSII